MRSRDSKQAGGKQAGPSATERPGIPVRQQHGQQAGNEYHDARQIRRSTEQEHGARQDIVEERPEVLRTTHEWETGAPDDAEGRGDLVDLVGVAWNVGEMLEPENYREESDSNRKRREGRSSKSATYPGWKLPRHRPSRQ